MDSGTEVVEESGKREREGAGCAAGLGLGFVDIDAQAGLGEHDGGGEAVGSGADDVGLVRKDSFGV